MSINKYLERAAQVYRSEGKPGRAFLSQAASDVIHYGDRLVGHTSRKLSAQAELGDMLMKKTKDPSLHKDFMRLDAEARKAREATSKSRFNTAVTIGAGALAYKAKKMYDQGQMQGSAYPGYTTYNQRPW